MNEEKKPDENPLNRGEIEGRNPHGTFKPGREKTGGRPKGSYSLTSLVKRLLQDDSITLKDGSKIPAGEALTKKILIQALDGDVQALKLIWNYVDGMPSQHNIHTGQDGGPIEVKNIREDFKSRIAGIIARRRTEDDPE